MNQRLSERNSQASALDRLATRPRHSHVVLDVTAVLGMRSVIRVNIIATALNVNHLPMIHIQWLQLIVNHSPSVTVSNG